MSESKGSRPGATNRLHRYAAVTAVATFALLIAGGLVTSTDSGLAVPDWPLSYGMWFPPMVGGIVYEHGHRMIAGIVGLMIVGLAGWLWRAEPRVWVRRLGYAALGVVLVQALLGGLTVLWLLPPAVSIAHACLGPIVFCLVVSIAWATTTPGSDHPATVDDPHRPSGRTLGLAVAILAALQLLLGAVIRHTGAEVTWHVIGAVALVVLAGWVTTRVVRVGDDARGVWSHAVRLLLLLCAQVVLGMAVLGHRGSVAMRTCHVGVGALVLAQAVILAWDIRRRTSVASGSSQAQAGVQVEGSATRWLRAAGWAWSRPSGRVARWLTAGGRACAEPDVWRGERPRGPSGARTSEPRNPSEARHGGAGRACRRAHALTGPAASAYLELTKARLSLLVLMTTAVGFWMGMRTPEQAGLMIPLCLGTALVVGGANALNQWLEREPDGLMQRTKHRPLPSGRIAPGAALRVGIGMSLAGLVVLAVAVNGLSAMLAAFSWAIYVLVYTPMKRWTPLCTLVGAIPGALPPVIGWAGARNSLGLEAWVLFAILFIWQLPHFLALAVLYRDDYARAGFPVLPLIEADGLVTARQTALYGMALIPISLFPTVIGVAGEAYFYGAILLSLVFFVLAARAAWVRSAQSARQLFRASVLYLPSLLGLLALNRV